MPHGDSGITVVRPFNASQVTKQSRMAAVVVSPVPVPLFSTILPCHRYRRRPPPPLDNSSVLLPLNRAVVIQELGPCLVF